MLRPTADRVNYSNELIPPENFELEFAVCTTYSLNMNTLISVILALGYRIESPSEADTTESIAAFLNIIKQLSDKLIIFCESGKINIPGISQKLFIMLEKMIVPVCLKSKNNYYPAFHPKTWLLKYKSKDSNVSIFKNLILSRNLTYDKNMDIIMSSEGKLGAEIVNKTKPLVSFYEFLIPFAANCPNIKGLERLLQEIQYVEFKFENTYDYEFIPNGIGTPDINEQPLFTRKDPFQRVFVMSPFVKKEFFKDFSYIHNDEAKNILVVRRNEAYQNLPEEYFKNFHVYDLKCLSSVQMIEQGSVNNKSISTTDVIENYNGFHAKIIGTYDGTRTSMYIGSLNATEAARNYNVEMMIRLDYKGNCLNNFISELIPEEDKKSYFEQIFFNKDFKPDTQVENENDANKLLKSICRLNLVGNYKSDNDGYCVEIKREKKLNEDLIDLKSIKDFTVSIAPLDCSIKKDFFLHEDSNQIISFHTKKSYEISEFFWIFICKDEKEVLSGITSIPIMNIYNLNRVDELKTDIYQNTNILFNSLKMMFQNGNSDYFDSLLNSEDEDGNMSANNKSYSISEVEIYESILKACVRDSNAIQRFIDFVTKVKLSEDGNSESLQNLAQSLKEFCEELKNV